MLGVPETETRLHEVADGVRRDVYMRWSKEISRRRSLLAEDGDLVHEDEHADEHEDENDVHEDEHADDHEDENDLGHIEDLYHYLLEAEHDENDEAEHDEAEHDEQETETHEEFGSPHVDLLIESLKVRAVYEGMT